MPPALLHIAYRTSDPHIREGYPGSYLNGYEGIEEFYTPPVPGQYEPVLFTLDEAGHVLRTFWANDDFPIYPVCMAADQTGYVYLGGYWVRTENDYQQGHGGLLKISRDNHKCFNLSHYHKNAPIYALALSPSGDLYLLGELVNDAGVLYEAGDQTGFYNLRKINAQGALLWAMNIFVSEFIGAQPYYLVEEPSILEVTQYAPPRHTISLVKQITVGEDQGVYVAFNFSTIVYDDLDTRIYRQYVYAIVKRISADGTQSSTLRLNRGSTLNLHTLDVNENVYCCGSVLNATHPEGPGYRGDGYPNITSRIIKINSALTSIVKAHDAEVYTGGIGGAGLANGRLMVRNDTLYAGGYTAFQTYDLDLTPLYATQRCDLTRFYVASDQSIYVPSILDREFFYYQGKEARKYNSDLSQCLWAEDYITFALYPNGLIESDFCVVENPETPALCLPFRLAPVRWEGDRYTQAMSLALRFIPRPPSWIREYLAKFPPPTIYRAYLTGTPPLELPIASFQCRRSAEGQTQLSLVSPAVGLALIDDLAARQTGELVLYRGIRFPSGIEHMDELVRVAFTGFRYDAGGQHASLSLTGQAATPQTDRRTRTLHGISYFHQSEDGIRRIRCELDTWLRPGDLAELGGGETFQVRDLVYWVSPHAAVMEVVERG